MKIKVSSFDLQLLRLFADGFSDKRVARKLNLPWSRLDESKRSLYRRIGENDPLKALHILARKGFTIED